MNVLWVIIAAIAGYTLHLLVLQLTGTTDNWKTFLASLITGAVNATGWALSQAFDKSLMLNIIAAILGGFSLTIAISYGHAIKIMSNKVKAMQGQIK